MTTVLRCGDHREMPWRNGGGTTLEVARTPQSETSEFDWRISFAHVDVSGPFSAFPGIDRVITLVEGDGMRLALNGGDVHELRAYEPFTFAGETAVDCAVDRATLDLNVMTRRGRYRADVVCHHGSVSVTAPTDLDDTVLVAALAGHPVMVTKDARLELEPLDVAVLDTDAIVRGDGVVAVLTLTRG